MRLAMTLMLAAAVLAAPVLAAPVLAAPVLAAPVLAAPVLAAPPIPLHASAPTQIPVSVTFSGALAKKLQNTYGEREAGGLRAAVTESVREALDGGVSERAASQGASVAVTVVDAAPTHPTFTQSLDKPSIDPLRTVSLGGAELSATIRAADGHALATVHYEHFVSDIAQASPAADPWADARLAIAGFSTQLAAKLRKLF